MKAENINRLNFYKHLGKLFYAIAAADKRVEKAEVEKLKTLVKTDWLKDDVEAYQIETVFKKLNSIEHDAESCFLDFIAYKKKHPELFSKATKKRIMKTAAAIAYAFSGINKSELIMLAKLDIELKKQVI